MACLVLLELISAPHNARMPQARNGYAHYYDQITLENEFLLSFSFYIYSILDLLTLI